MSALPIGEFSSSSLSKHLLHVFSSNVTHDSNLQPHETEILKTLVLEDPTLFSQAGAITENVSDALNHHIMVNSRDNDSNIAASFEFITETALSSQNKDYIEKLNLTKINAPQFFTNNVSLGSDNAPLYNGNIKFEYIDGDSVYSSVTGGHYLSFDTSDNDYNLHKGMNSTLSNTAVDATDGIQGVFNYSFNSDHAFYTENILQRNSNNTVAVGQTIGAEGISTSTGVAGDNNWETLQQQIVSSNDYPDNHPLFGSLKFIQDSLIIDFPLANNILDSASTLSKLLNSTNLNTAPQATATSRPDATLTEQQFQDLFTPTDLEKVGPGYDFNLNIVNESTDGYILDSTNDISIPNYDDANTLENNMIDSMFTIDDSEILENAQYMKEMYDNGYFNNNSHKLYVKNGNLVKHFVDAANLNFDKFTILDGVEKLIATTNNDITDLNKRGIISVKDTNNSLGDAYARYRKYTNDTYANTTSDSTRVNRLVVNYSNVESDYRIDTGIINSTDFIDNYYVQSEISTLNNSTNTNHDVDVFSPTLHPNINAARANNSVLLFQVSPDSSLYNSSNIYNYQASGLDNYVQSNKFALFSLIKTLSFEDSDESPLFNTSTNATIEGVVSNVSISNLDLNEFNAEDIRVLIHGKKKSDIPLPSDNLWEWYTGDETNGNLTSHNFDSNDGHLVSEKAGLDYLGNKIYEVLNLDPSLDISVQYILKTDSVSLPSKDILARSAEVIITIPNQIPFNVEVENDDKDLAFFDISEVTSTGVTQDLTDLQNTQPYYVVKQYTTTKEYHVAIRSRVGPYKNLWIVRQVKEFTEWYQLINTNKNNKIMPDYYLNNILDEDGNQKFKANRKFETDSGELSSELSTNVNFKVKDLMGFKVSVEYNNGTSWLPFILKADSDYEHSLDPMYDRATLVTLMNPNDSTQEFANMRVTCDSPMSTSLGLYSHISQTNNSNNTMYIININVPQGYSSFIVNGYIYDVATDSQYFDKNDSWSPYSTSDNLFLKNGDNFVGSQITSLSTHVELIDPTPSNITNVNEINHVKVTVKQGDNELFSFISNKYILENFNIVHQKQVIVQHDYLVHKTEYSQIGAILSGTEYLASTYVTNVLDVVKLNFGANYNGIRADVKPASHISSTDRVSTSYFRLAGDRVQIKPLDDDSNSHDSNRYTARYSNLLGEEILPSLAGEPLPTNSLIHRNVHPTIFRSLQNGQSTIVLLRTMSTIKLVIGDKFVDDMNIFDNTNTDAIWYQRVSFQNQEATLRSMKMFKATTSFNQLQLEDMTKSIMIGTNPTGSSGDIGSLGLKVIPNFSMFPTAISSVLHKVNILLSASSYQKTIVNPLDTSVNVSVSSNLFDYNLHQFRDFALVATRIKVYGEENYNFKYIIPDLKVFHSPQYIGDPRTLSNWTQIQTYTDTQLRAGVIIGSELNAGVVEFTKNQSFVSGFTKYCILARPTATLSSYDVSDLVASVPDNFVTRTYQRKLYGVDINITNPSGSQGLAANLQTHKPFNKNPAVNVPNQLNIVTSNVGLNNVTLGFNVAKYLHLREVSNKPTETFSFTMTSNKIKLSNGIGLTGNSPIYNVMFNGYISELSNSSKWDSELGPSIVNIFNANKKWDLNIKQLTYPIAQFIDLNPSTLLDNSIIINGISSFGMDSYNLDLVLLDSVRMRIYKVNHTYEPITDTQKVTFYRYSTIEGIPWITQNDFSKSSLFKPLLTSKQTCELSVYVPNNLYPTPHNVDTLIKQAIVSSNFTSLTWSTDENFISVKSPISFVPLSTKGAGSLLEILQLTKEHPFKVLTSKRPYILDVKRADGSRAFAINHDGKLLSHRVITKRVELLQQTEYPDTTFEHLTSVFSDHHVQAQNDD